MPTTVRPDGTIDAAVAGKDRDVGVDGPPIETSSARNSKENEALIRNLGELSNLIDKVSQNPTTQKNAAFKKLLDQARDGARKQLDVLKSR